MQPPAAQSTNSHVVAGVNVEVMGNDGTCPWTEHEVASVDMKFRTVGGKFFALRFHVDLLRVRT